MSHRLRDTVLIQGYILLVMAAAMTVPCCIAFSKNEEHAASAFILTIVGCIICGVSIVKYWKPSPVRVKSRDGYLVVSVSWLVASLAGSVPFYASGAIPHFIDAFFESCSGFTTTGSSILTDIEALPDSILFWRSFTHWLGGMGILVLVMALLPSLGISGQNIANSETPGPTKDKVTARFSETARDLYLIYIGMTILVTVLLVISGLSWFDALIHTFGSVGTGGFSNYNDSVGHFNNVAAEWIIIVFMFLSGVNFNLYYLTGRSGLRVLAKDDEFRFYSWIIALFSGMIFLCRSFTGGFAGFQALMPLIGWVLGIRFQQYIVSIDHWIAFVLLAIIGGKMIYESIKGDEGESCELKDAPLNHKELVVLAIATSIDALAIGITFAFLDTPIFPAIAIIGISTFFICLLGVVVGNIFGSKYKNKAEFAGGFILVMIGLKILLEHLGILPF